jgi:hypothetical protein
MSPVVAEMVLYAITAIAVVVWVEGLRFLVATMRGGKKGSEEFAKLDEPAPANLIYGSAEIEGSAAELSRKAAGLLVAKSARICERTDEMIDFETSSDFFHGQKINLPSLHGQMRFTSVSAQTTRVDYAITRPRVQTFLIPGFVFEGLGFMAIITGFLLIYFLVIPSRHPGVRWNTLQMLQVVHFLWPPFMFAGMYRKTTSVIRAQFDTFIHNLPFLAT